MHGDRRKAAAIREKGAAYTQGDSFALRTLQQSTRQRAVASRQRALATKATVQSVFLIVYVSMRLSMCL